MLFAVVDPSREYRLMTLRLFPVSGKMSMIADIDTEGLLPVTPSIMAVVRESTDGAMPAMIAPALTLYSPAWL